MAVLTEAEIISTVYSLYETDTDSWAATDEEYLAARSYCNIAIRKWEFYDNTCWNELYSTLTAASDGTKTTTAGTYAYACPTDFRRPSSWVRVAGTYWVVVSPPKSADYAEENARVCWFTGSEKGGFYLNFNSNVTLTTADTIEYEYYKSASLFTTTTSTTEISDPYYIVYFVLARFLKNDGEDNLEELQEADDRLETMRVANMSGVFNVPDQIEETLDITGGFGT